MKLGILTLATGKYLDYWCDMVLSAEKRLNSETFEFIFHVFTDQIHEARVMAQNLTKFKIIVHEIPAYNWPEATILRYRCIENIAGELDEDVLMHLDADMLIIEDFIQELDFDKLEGGVGLVAHPGYWRPKGLERFKLYGFYPLILVSDIKTYFQFGALGAWEKREQSKAYVPKRNRRIYVCGGTWFGLRQEFLTMVSECAKNVDTDSSNHEMAIWHDESHLNRWAANNIASKLKPSFCFDPTYPQLQSLPEFIRAVDKSKTFRSVTLDS